MTKRFDAVKGQPQGKEDEHVSLLGLCRALPSTLHGQDLVGHSVAARRHVVREDDPSGSRRIPCQRREGFMTGSGAARSTNQVELPSQVSSEVGFFDRFAGWAAGLASRAPFFAFCLLLVVIWLIQGAVVVISTQSFGNFLDATYQLEINTTTTIITFLMVALLQNSQTRENQATQHKLNAIADGIADLMEHLSDRHDDADLKRDVDELRSAVGLESRESTTHNARMTAPGTNGHSPKDVGPAREWHSPADPSSTQ
ncbi:MAG: low affinity iron permease family protein [Actinomycetota bacterium]